MKFNLPRERRAPGASALALALALGSTIGCSSGSLSTGTDSADKPDKAVGVVSQANSGGATFGVGCSDSFQNNWQDSLADVWTNCNGFFSEFNRSSNGVWSYNLVNGQGWWEQPSGYGNNVNSVEFFFADTHGGAFSNSAVYAMWDQNSLAYTAPVSGHTGMRLTATEGLFTYACQTLATDSAVLARWGSVFRGGLRIATGSQGTVYSGYWTDDSGSDFADDLNSVESIHDAWFDGLWDFYVGQDVAVMASGTGSTIADCNNRLYGMNVYNRLGYPKYTDNQNTWLCWDEIHE